MSISGYSTTGSKMSYVTRLRTCLSGSSYSKTWNSRVLLKLRLERSEEAGWAELLLDATVPSVPSGLRTIRPWGETFVCSVNVSPFSCFTLKVYVLSNDTWIVFSGANRLCSGWDVLLSRISYRSWLTLIWKERPRSYLSTSFVNLIRKILGWASKLRYLTKRLHDLRGPRLINVPSRILLNTSRSAHGTAPSAARMPRFTKNSCSCALLMIFIGRFFGLGTSEPSGNSWSKISTL